MATALRRVCILSGLGIVVAAILLRAAPVSFAQSSTLTQRFPALATLPDSHSLAIGIGWMGLSPLSPISATYLLELRNDQFEGTGKVIMAKETTSQAVAVPRDAVRSFLTAATKVELIEKDYVARITHTDDYPSLSFEIGTAEGLLEIWTSSQTQRTNSADYFDRTPWAISYLHQTFVVMADDLDRTFDAFAPQLKYDEMTDLLAKKAFSHD